MKPGHASLGSRSSRRQWLRAAVSALGVPAITRVAGSAPSAALEYEVKAAMLYNFTKFVEWPAAAWTDSKAPFVVAVAGDDPFGKSLEAAFQDKAAAGRPVAVRPWDPSAAHEAAHILFVSRSEKKRTAELLAAFAQRPVLTVSDLGGFARSGGVIGFVLDDDRVRFEINLDASQKAGLRISSRLLRLAWSTLGDPGGQRG